MKTERATYELRDGRLLVNGEAVPIRKGILYFALARAGWTGNEGPLSRETFEKVLDADRRISMYALRAELQTPAA